MSHAQEKAFAVNVSNIIVKITNFPGVILIKFMKKLLIEVLIISSKCTVNKCRQTL